MDFSERVENILNEKKISKAKMLSDLKLGKNQFTYWKKNHTIPNGFSVQAIAEYLNVSVDYLLGKGNFEMGEPSENINIIKIAGRDGSYEERTLTDEQLELFKKMIDALPKATDL